MPTFLGSKWLVQFEAIFDTPQNGLAYEVPLSVLLTSKVAEQRVIINETKTVNIEPFEPGIIHGVVNY